MCWNPNLHVFAFLSLDKIVEIPLFNSVNIKFDFSFMVKVVHSLQTSLITTPRVILGCLQSCLPVRGALQFNEGVAKADGVWLTRGRVWMFHLTHKECRVCVLTKPEEIKHTGGGSYKRVEHTMNEITCVGESPESNDMPRFYRYALVIDFILGKVQFWKF